MLQQDQEVFNILLEAVSEGVIIVDNNQLIVDINTTAESIFGYEKNELINKKLNLLIPSKYHHKHKQHFIDFIKEDKKRSMVDAIDIYGLKKSGDVINIEIELNPFKIYDKNYVMALIKDVSAIKETEKNLMLKSSALQSAINGIVITDAQKPDNPIIYFNAAFQNLTGYSSEEILNHNCRFLQGKDRNQEPLKELRQAVKKGKSCQVTLRNYKKDGTLFWNDLYIMPIIDNKGVVTNFIGIQNDVTLRKKTEAERNHLATIFDESLNEIYVFDAKTLKFINANYGAQKNLGYTIEELKTMTPLDLKTEIHQIEFKKHVEKLLKKNVEKLEFENVHQRKDGTTYPVEVHMQLSSLGERDVIVVIILDITERKNYTERLEKKVEERTEQLKIALSKEKELNELKTKFLSLVSHEFKTPLSGILTSSVLLSKYQLTKDQEKRNKHIKTISDKVHYLNNILNDFLSLEKLETGKMNYNYNHFKISKVIDEVVYNANMLLKKNQNIKYPDHIDDLSLYQDEKVIELILTNLVNNAIKYSPEDTDITITIEQNNTITTIQVIDSGIGIPLNDQKHIFERYFRAENVINTQGTGIGLNIAKNHLENIGGTISFISEEQKGTTFTIKIPNTANP
ncbi:PAS domain S-box protein [Winogradskyella litoriviva]|uniref:histidine kinase n=1 Tax=Winogradskyella litoriviva TaxID=1220182 RepID=A0ABX2EAG1_9FLAO|nr:PAS domain-containing sensor histidine kinase [Winogradskyella litoriviva]NRD24626.1 PAS domain S-box protein [Winogradskyella litoriviva]